MPLPPFSPPSAQRSRNMSAIRSQDTKPEMFVRRAIHGAGFRFRLRTPSLPGKPDLILPRFRLTIFVHGCFWHGHDCKFGHVPRTNQHYWSKKLDRNKVRDRANIMALKELGWNTLILWECSLADDVNELITRLQIGKRVMPSDSLRSSGLISR